MAILLLILTVFISVMFPTLTCAVKNLWRILYYLPKDIFFYILHKEYNKCPKGAIVGLTALFGKGKTLTMIHIVAKYFMMFNNKKVWCPRRKKYVTQKIKIISNVHFNKIPYEKLITLQQAVFASENNKYFDDRDDTLTVTLVLIDEASVQLNSRKFKENIDPLFLNSILTCRHNYLSIYYTAQRDKHVDALLRQVTSYYMECDKLWRLQRVYYYDSWELENASNPKMIKPIKRTCWFVRDKDYNSYDTFACVENLIKDYKNGDMITEEEIMKLNCNNPDAEQIMKPSRKFKRIRKKLR